MKYLFSFLAIVFLQFDSFSQNWVELMRSGADIYEVENKFNEEWSNSEYTKGKGYKQFKRWKSFWEPRLYPSGSFENAQVNILENDKWFVRDKKGNERVSGNWQSLGLDEWVNNNFVPGNGRINVVYKDPNFDNVLFAGSPSGGLWKSSDDGDSWEPLTDNIPVMGVSGVVVDYNDPDIIYISTGDDDNQDTYSVGVLKSTDGGDTWNTTGLNWFISEQVRIKRLLMHPTNPEILLCGSNEGLYRTDNAGLTWDLVYSGNIKDVEYKIDDENIVYVTKEKLYRSTDGGLTYESYGEGLPSVGAVTSCILSQTADNTDALFLLYSDNNWGYYGLYYSSDGGANFEIRSSTPNLLNGDQNGFGVDGQAWYDMELAVSPQDENDILIGGVNLWESNDGGLNWELNAYWVKENNGLNYVHADIHHLEYVGNELYCGSDGGVFRSTNFGNSFTDLSSGLVIAQNYRLGISQQDSDLLLTGAQDNGTNILSDDVWTHVAGGDGFEAIVSHSNPNVMFSSSQYGSINKSTDGGNSFNYSAVGITESGAWSTPYIMSPINSNILYSGYENVWRSSNEGDSWEKISEFDDQLVVLDMPMINPNVIYAASNSDIYKTTEGGNSWTEISGGIPSNAITYLEVDPMDPDRLWVTLSGFTEGQKVYYTENSGEDWINISGGLPNIPINCILYDANTDDDIYIGTDQGIYFKNSNLADWESFNQNLPNVIVTELEIHEDDQLIFASTFGRGIWVSDLWQLPELPPVANFSFFPVVICEGAEVEFQDQSILNQPIWDWQFEGGITTVSTQMNPSVVYENSGVYDVVLTVENENGTDTYTCVDCIHVYSNEGMELPFVEGFEDSQDLETLNWFVEPQSSSINWEISDEAYASGQQSLFLNNFNLDIQSEYEVITQPFNLSAEPGEDNYYLSFKYAYAQISGEEDDRFRIYLSDDCGQSWSLKGDWQAGDDLISFGNLETAFIPGPNDWIQENLELDDVAITENTLIKIWFRNENGNNIYIDDINIFSGTVSVDQYENLQNKVFPNPFNDFVSFELPNLDSGFLTLHDELGRTVYESNVVDNDNVDLSKLSKGIYFYKVFQGDDLLYFGKLIKK